MTSGARFWSARANSDGVRLFSDPCGRTSLQSMRGGQGSDAAARPRRRLGRHALGGEQRHVVLDAGVPAVRLHRGDDRVLGSLERETPRVRDPREKRLDSELAPRGSAGLGDAVGVEERAIPRAQVEMRLLEGCRIGDGDALIRRVEGAVLEDPFELERADPARVLRAVLIPCHANLARVWCMVVPPGEPRHPYRASFAASLTSCEPITLRWIWFVPS